KITYSFFLSSLSLFFSSFTKGKNRIVRIFFHPLHSLLFFLDFFLPNGGTHIFNTLFFSFPSPSVLPNDAFETDFLIIQITSIDIKYFTVFPVTFMLVQKLDFKD